jgi:hypothetical protein
MKGIKMKAFRKWYPELKFCVFVLIALWMTVGVNAAHAEWHFGIGTGMARWTYDGDIGFNTSLAGPVEAEVDLKPEDFDDLMQSAVGFAGFATNGDWLILYSYSHLELGDDGIYTAPSDAQAKYDINFDITAADIGITRHIYKGKHALLGVVAGVRYKQHDLTSELTVAGTDYKKNIDNNWTDALIGASVLVPFAEKWSWKTGANAGFGESESSFYANSGVTWNFHKHWAATAFTTYIDVEYENGDKGDSDWYYYDAKEYAYGLTVMFTW